MAGACSVEGCDRPVLARGWCHMHYYRWYRATPAEERAAMPDPRVGRPSWNKGIPMRPESKEKLRLRPVTLETRAKIRSARARQVLTPERNAAVSRGNLGKPKAPEAVAKRSGPNHPYWKGGHSRSMNSNAWRSMRSLVLARDSYRCQKCGATDRLVVHHIIEYRDGGPDLPDNLVTWCRPCHHSHHATLR